MSNWTIFSNYGHVLLFLAREPKARLRDVAVQVGITERAVQNIVHELEQSGYLSIRKRGRCNQYKVNGRKHLRHTLESKLKVGQLVRLLQGSAKPESGLLGESKQAAASPAPAEPETAPAAEPRKERRQSNQLETETAQQSLDF